MNLTHVTGGKVWDDPKSRTNKIRFSLGILTATSGLILLIIQAASLFNPDTLFKTTTTDFTLYPIHSGGILPILYGSVLLCYGIISLPLPRILSKTLFYIALIFAIATYGSVTIKNGVESNRTVLAFGDWLKTSQGLTLPDKTPYIDSINDFTASPQEMVQDKKPVVVLFKQSGKDTLNITVEHILEVK